MTAPADPADTATIRRIGIAIGAAAVAVVLWSVLAGGQPPPTFGYDRSGLLERWNEAALAENLPGLIIREFQWTDEQAGVFGFAFSESMSLLGRVDGTPIGDVEELALVGSRTEDGLATIVSGMGLVIAVTEPDLDAESRAEILSDLTLTGVVPADPDQRVTAGDTRYRVAADPVNDVLGIGAAPESAER